MRIDTKLTFFIDTKTGEISVFDDHTGKAITDRVDLPYTGAGAYEPGIHDIHRITEGMSEAARTLIRDMDSPVINGWFERVCAEWRENNPEEEPGEEQP